MVHCDENLHFAPSGIVLIEGRGVETPNWGRGGVGEDGGGGGGGGCGAD